MPGRSGFVVRLYWARPGWRCWRTPSVPKPGQRTRILIAELDKAFAVPAEPMKPPLLIFPTVGADERVSSEGVGLSHLATFAAVYTDRKHIDICAPLTQNVLRDAGALKPGVTLDAETIRLCLAALGAKLYAIPKLVGLDDGELLTIACHGDGEKYRDRTFTHPLKRNERHRVPSLIAQDVLEYLGVQLTPREREIVAAPPARDEADLRILLGILATGNIGKKDEIIEPLLERNPHCVLAWENYFSRSAAAVPRFRQMQPPLECPRSHLSSIVQVRNQGDPARDLRMLLPFAASHRDDTYFQTSLFKCAALLKDERLAPHVLELWRKAEPGYTGCTARGEQLIDWAWQARGSGWASTVTPEGARRFEERLQDARRELEQALKINPDGWVAHYHLLTVARGLGLPREFVEDHFQKAVKLRPRFRLAYSAKMEYLRPRWHGSEEEMIAFGRQCAATGFWDEGIPGMFPYAVRDCCLSPGEHAANYQILQLQDMWDGVLEYYRAAEKDADPTNRNMALNYLAEWGIYSGHFDDVVVACQRLRHTNRVERSVFPDWDEWEFLYNLVHAKTGRLTTQYNTHLKNDRALAQTGVALGQGDFDEAARTIEQVEPGEHLDANKLATYRAAITAGRKLYRDRRLDLKGAEGLELFVGSRPQSFAPSPSPWKYGDDKFVCELPANGKTVLSFPVGIRHGVISGTFEWSGDLSYCQLVAHSHSLRDPVTLRYLPDRKVQLARNNMLVRETVAPPGPIAFRLTYGVRQDVLEPFKGESWEASGRDDVPSGFSIQVFARGQPVTFTLRNLHIELTN